MNSINLTIHNKGYLISSVLGGIFNNTSMPFELIIVLDGCTDDSEHEVVKFLSVNSNKQLKKFLILYANDVFETKSNNIAAKESSGDFIMIVQDDCVITEYGWDERLIKPFMSYSDVFAVSGNCAHNWEVNPNSKDISDLHVSGPMRLMNPPKDWCDILNHIQHAKQGIIDRDIFAIRDSCNRGPLAINNNDLKSLNYFDEAFSPQDSDDHDLMYRMHKKLGKVCGYYGIGFKSLPSWGGTRDANGATKQWMFAANHKNTRLLYERHKDIITTHKFENRILR